MTAFCLVLGSKEDNEKTLLWTVRGYLLLIQYRFVFAIVLLLHKGTLQKQLISDFFPLRGGGVPPFPLSFFEHNGCPLSEGGYPPIPLWKKSDKRRLFLAKKR